MDLTGHSATLSPIGTFGGTGCGIFMAGSGSDFIVVMGQLFKGKRDAGASGRTMTGDDDQDRYRGGASPVVVKGGTPGERERLRATLGRAGYHVTVDDNDQAGDKAGDRALSLEIPGGDANTGNLVPSGALAGYFMGWSELGVLVNSWVTDVDGDTPDRSVKGDGVCLFMLNLDHFKRARAFLGDETALVLLREVAIRIAQVAAQYDQATKHDQIDETDQQGPETSRIMIGHVDVDEFVIAIRGLSDRVAAARFARAVLKSISLPYEGVAAQVYLTGRIGITFGPDDGVSCDGLVRNVASIVHHEERAGRNSYHFYAEGMADTATRRFEFEAILSQAVNESAFEVYYQPQANFQDGRIMGAEALVRLRHEGEIMPAELFIATAEDIGLIAEIGARVLTAACAEARRVHDLGLGPFEISINISAYQFRRLDMVEAVRKALDQSGLDPASLVLEVTESLVLSDVERTVETFAGLRAMGVHLALDDFGTGYSSLSYLKSLTIDRLKIDRSFVKGLPDDPGDRAVTGAIVRMAKALGLQVTAEGIETDDQRTYLTALGCDHYQGYLLARPLAAPDLETFLSGYRAQVRS